MGERYIEYRILESLQYTSMSNLVGYYCAIKCFSMTTPFFMLISLALRIFEFEILGYNRKLKEFY